VFGLGMMEIGLIVALAVMLFPPKELPKLARMIARIYGQVRRTAEDFRSAVLEDEDLRSPIDEIKGAYDDARYEIRDAERKARQQLAKAQMEMRLATARRLQAEREAKAKAGDGAKSAEAEGEGEGEISAAESGDKRAEAKPLEPVPEAANEPGEPAEPAESEAPAVPVPPAPKTGAVAGRDPRVIAGRRSGPYTPRAVAGEDQDARTAEGAASEDTDDDGGEPREGVA
jgi:Sec-independent protein translocase protein TatA